MSKISKDMNTIELLVRENSKLTRSLRDFLKWYDRHHRNSPIWSDEFHDGTDFFDLQEIADRARAVLAP